MRTKILLVIGCIIILNSSVSALYVRENDPHARAIDEIAIAKNYHQGVLNLSGFNIHVVPVEIGQLTDLRILDLSNNQLQELPTAIQNLQQLQVLDLSGNQFETFPAQILKFQNLRQLHLSHNLLSELPDTIGELAQLEVLYVDHNQIMTLPTTLSQLSHLTHLNISYNLLNDIPEQFRAIITSETQFIYTPAQPVEDIPYPTVQPTPMPAVVQSAQTVTATGFVIDSTVLEDKFNRMDMGLGAYLRAIRAMQAVHNHGTVLHLDDLNLYDLPPEIEQLVQLSELTLSNNHLETLPPEIGALGLLQTLRINNNKLRTLPPELGQLSSLKYLVVSHNQLQQLPLNIDNLRQLEILSVNHNPLQYLPHTIAELRKLRVLMANDTQITALPSNLGRNQRLSTLDVTNTLITNIPGELHHYVTTIHYSKTDTCATIDHYNWRCNLSTIMSYLMFLGGMTFALVLLVKQQFPFRRALVGSHPEHNPRVIDIQWLLGDTLLLSVVPVVLFIHFLPEMLAHDAQGIGTGILNVPTLALYSRYYKLGNIRKTLLRPAIIGIGLIVILWLFGF